MVVDAATNLFKVRGFEAVSMAEIGAAVDMTAPALYRHFASKQALLTAVIAESINAFEQTIEQVAEDAGRADDLSTLAGGLARVTVEHLGAGVLWQRESRYLAQTDRTALRRRVRAEVMKIARILAERLPVHSQTHAEVLSWAALAAITSPSRHRSPVMQASGGVIVQTVVLDVWRRGADLQITAPPELPRLRRVFLSRTSRREAIIDAALYTFARRGYPETTMDEIGGVVGITGPSVHHYFPKKSELLVEVVERGAQWLRLDLARAIGNATTPGAAITGLIQGYVGFAFQSGDLAQVLASESNYLPAEVAESIRSIEEDYVAQWTALLRAANPAATATIAPLRVYAALSIIVDLGRLVGVVGSVLVSQRDVVLLAAAALDLPDLDV